MNREYLKGFLTKTAELMKRAQAADDSNWVTVTTASGAQVRMPPEQASSYQNKQIADRRRATSVENNQYMLNAFKGTAGTNNGSSSYQQRSSQMRSAAKARMKPLITNRTSFAR